MSMTLHQGLVWLRQAVVSTPFPDEESDYCPPDREPYINCLLADASLIGTNLLLFLLQGRLWLIPWRGDEDTFTPELVGKAWIKLYSDAFYHWNKQFYRLDLPPWPLTNWIKEHR